MESSTRLLQQLQLRSGGASLIWNIVARAILPAAVMHLRTTAASAAAADAVGTTATAAPKTTSMTSAVLKVSAVKLLLVLLDGTAADKRGALLELLLPPLCGAIAANAHDAQFLLLCGRAMIRAAQLAPAEFRTAVPQLHESHRTALQRVMVLAAEQQQKSEPAASAAASAPGAGRAPTPLAISVDRFRK